MDYKHRFWVTQKISGDVWGLYKKYSYVMDDILKLSEPEQRNWWNKVNQEFTEIAKKYYKTTHEFYAQEYCIACLDDLNTIWKAKQEDAKMS